MSRWVTVGLLRSEYVKGSPFEKFPSSGADEGAGFDGS